MMSVVDIFNNMEGSWIIELIKLPWLPSITDIIFNAITISIIDLIVSSFPFELTQVIVGQGHGFKIWWSIYSSSIISKLQLDVLSIIFTFTSLWDLLGELLKVNCVIVIVFWDVLSKRLIFLIAQLSINLAERWVWMNIIWFYYLNCLFDTLGILRLLHHDFLLLLYLFIFRLLHFILLPFHLFLKLFQSKCFSWTHVLLLDLGKTEGTS